LKRIVSAASVSAASAKSHVPAARERVYLRRIELSPAPGLFELLAVLQEVGIAA